MVDRMSRTATGAIEANIDHVDPTVHPRVVVTGAAGIIGGRVARKIVQTLPQYHVSGIDRFSGSTTIDEFHLADLATADLLPLLAGVDVLVHCSFNVRADAVTAQDGRVDLAIMRRVLKAAAISRVNRVIVLSSAMVYGAWPDNPMPITEDGPVRPNPEYAFALHLASVEAVARNWAEDGDGRKLTIMRPAVLVTEERRGGLSDLLASASVIRSESGDAPAQYLHVDDLASAIALVVGSGADGVFNIAPDGWISADDLTALAGPKPRLHLPDPAARLLSAVRFRLGFTRTPPGIMPYITHPWVVANDRIRELGWDASNSNEEAYVAGHDAGPLGNLNAKRRQTLALGATAVAVLAAAAGASWLIRRARRGH